MEPLVDSYGRRIKSMRISITDKCNFRCTYCMPAEGLPWLKKAEILSYEEIERISRVAVEMGIEQIRLTGGEPLVRRDVPELVCQLRQLPGLRSLTRSLKDSQSWKSTLQFIPSRSMQSPYAGTQKKRYSISPAWLGTKLTQCVGLNLCHSMPTRSGVRKIS